MPLRDGVEATSAARRVIESTSVGRYEIALTQNSGGLNSQRLQALLVDSEAKSKASPHGVCTGFAGMHKDALTSFPDQPSALTCRGLFFVCIPVATKFPVIPNPCLQGVSSGSVRLASSRIVAGRAGSSICPLPRVNSGATAYTRWTFDHIKPYQTIANEWHRTSEIFCYKLTFSGTIALPWRSVCFFPNTLASACSNSSIARCFSGNAASGLFR